MAKHIFVTGGVVSSLGKGLTCASIGMLLEHRGLRVRLQKFDPYINIDPGTMSPYQHGEVYVLDDGGETDLDLGHYERFTNAPLTRESNYTTGKIYMAVIKKEREGSYYEGKTVQVIPHVTDEIKDGIRRLASDDVDVVITEIGGTVGDIESLPFLEAIRQFALDVGRENCLYIHLTLIPYLKAAAELKTKPTQHSVGSLRQIGIQPDILICRTEHPISEGDKDKIALFCNIERKAVIEERDREFSIYEVPLSLNQNGLDDQIVRRLNLKAGPLDISDWREMVDRIVHPATEVTIAVVGKYMKHRDAYKSVYESLDHAGIANRARVVVRRIEAEEIGRNGVAGALAGVDGLLVPGGFGMRGIEGKIEAIRHARLKGIPFFGICLGMQCAAIEFARSVLGLDDANSNRVQPEHATSGHRPHGRPGDRPRARRDDAARGLGMRPDARLAGARRLRHRPDPRAPPAPLRIQQPLPEPVRRRGPDANRPQPRRLTGRDRRGPRPPLVPCRPVPPRIPVQADPGPPPLPRLRRRSAQRRDAARQDG